MITQNTMYAIYGCKAHAPAEMGFLVTSNIELDRNHGQLSV